jgi:hypothetical protein
MKCVIIREEDSLNLWSFTLDYILSFFNIDVKSFKQCLIIQNRGRASEQNLCFYINGKRAKTGKRGIEKSGELRNYLHSKTDERGGETFITAINWYWPQII